MAARSGAESGTPKRQTYRHGDLRNALIRAGVELAGEGGPDAVVLREATRRAGVVPNAAYRHFADRRALLAAVRQEALAELAAALEAAQDAADGEPRARLRAIVLGYVDFAQARPGLFRAAFTTGDMADTGGEAAAGPGGATAFELLGAALDGLVESGDLPPERRPGAEYFVWSAVHGLSVLLIDGPLRGLLPVAAEEAGKRLLDSIERGL